MAAPRTPEEFLPRPHTRIKRRVLLNLQRGLYWSRAGRIYVGASQVGGAIIYEYHSVAPPDEARWIDPRNRIPPERFERQMRFLARQRSVISMDELVDALDRNTTVPAGSVVLTFDDGYRDNFHHVAPVLESFGFSATLYLPTGLVSRRESPWPDRVYAAFLFRRNDRFEHASIPGSPFVLEGERSREAYGAIAGALLDADRAQRDDILRALYEQLEPTVEPPCLTLDWDTLRTMQKRHPRFELGVHSENHIDLTAHGTDTAAAEMDRCIATYTKELGRAPKHFAYPYDRHDDRTHELLSSRPIASGVGSGEGFLIQRGADRYALARLEPPASMSLFRFWSSGAYPGLPRALFGRA